MLKFVLLFFCVFVGINLSSTITLGESAAKNFIIESSENLAAIYSELAEIVYYFADINLHEIDEEKHENLPDHFSKYLEEQTARMKELTQNITAISEEAYKFSIEEFEDEEIKIGIWKLKSIPGLLTLNEEYEKWISSDFDDFLKLDNYCRYQSSEQSSKNDKKCNLKYNDILNKLAREEMTYDQITYYWEELRNRNSREAKERMRTFLELLRKLAMKYNSTPKFVWLINYLDENFDYDMERAMNELSPLFKEVHGYVRHILHEKYPDKVSTNGLIPHHLYEQFVSDAKVKAPVPTTPQLSAFSGFRPLPRRASDFMLSLGLSNLPEDYWIKNSRRNQEHCETVVYDSGHPIYLRYCEKTDFKNFLKLHGYLARIHFSNERKDLPFVYSNGIYDIDIAAAEAVVLSASAYKYLNDIGLEGKEEDISRLLRMSRSRILAVPEYFVHSKVVADVLDGKVFFDNMNDHYWKLMRKYVGVQPPVERTSDSFDFQMKFYRNIIHGGLTTKFATNIMSYQIYEALCKETGEFIEVDSAHPLHNCNIYGNKKAGEMLQKIIKIGATKPWKELLGTVTGSNDGMTAKSILEYFAPLKEWLEKKNMENGAPTGW